MNGKFLVALDSTDEDYSKSCSGKYLLVVSWTVLGIPLMLRCESLAHCIVNDMRIKFALHKRTLVRQKMVFTAHLCLTLSDLFDM